MKALVGAFNQEKALVGAFSVIVQPVVEPMDRFAALFTTCAVVDAGQRVLDVVHGGQGDDLAVHGLHGGHTGHSPHTRQVMVTSTAAAADYGLVVPVLVAQAAKLLQPAVNSSNKD